MKKLLPLTFFLFPLFFFGDGFLTIQSGGKSIWSHNHDRVGHQGDAGQD